MFAQYIKIGRKQNPKWNVLIYYNVKEQDFVEIEDSLIQLDCPDKDIYKALNVLYHRKNTGFTFSNSDYKMSIICIAPTTSASQFVSTAIHEAKHVQSHICSYYNVPEDGEDAAYLIGYIVRRMYKMVSKMLKHYITFIEK